MQMGLREMELSYHFRSTSWYCWNYRHGL